MGLSASVTAPVAASTVILTRPSVFEPAPDDPASPGGFEVFLVKRHRASGFMAGVHVFPGGKVDEDDRQVDFGSFAATLTNLLDGDPAACASVAAAARETFEECGVQLDAKSLVPFAWWVTPEAEPRRFDTRFFLAPLPVGQHAVADGREVDDGLWLTPRAALAAYAEGRIALAPPTLVALEDLSLWDDVEEARRAVKRPIRCVCPVLHTLEGGEVVLVLPGDPLHPDPDVIWAARTRLVRTHGPNGPRFSSVFVAREQALT